MAERWVRAPLVRIFDVQRSMVIVGADGSARELTGDSAELARALLAFVAAPRTRDAIVAHVEELSGAALEPAQRAVVDELVKLLAELGVLVAAPGGSHAPVARPLRRLVLCLAGAVAAMHAPALVQLLHRRGFDVRVAATPTALRFVQADALAALTHRPPLSELFSTDPELPVPHINLAGWADAVLVWPATATTVGRLATGDHSTLVSAIALATRAPVVVVPSMNVDMYSAPATQRNLAQLVADGMHVVHPASGIEVADAPAERGSVLGPTPPHAVVVQLLEAILARRGVAPRRPDDARGWDEIYRGNAAPPWQSARLDDDLAARLDALPPGALLDIGTGLGTVAVEAARRGHRVVATDVSRAALARAEEAAPDAGVVWLEDDVAESRLRGAFDVAIDRGCLHLVAPARAAGYAAAVARLVRPGGVLLLKAFEGDEAARRGTMPYGAAEVLALLGDAFALEADEASSIPGPSDAPPARLYVLRRRQR
jgi:SAM-dependent methyltransferase/3-polyprenyl-4-hydroxybenzoate decarboxylase